jgi:hypothetical protein
VSGYHRFPASAGVGAGAGAAAAAEAALPDHVISVSSHGKVRHYVGYGERVLQVRCAVHAGEGGGAARVVVAHAAGRARVQELQRELVVVVGKGKAISKAVTVAEILKRAVPGLHQETAIASETTLDRWEPKEPQMDRYDDVDARTHIRTWTH